jgi:guanine nucleotide-binding protein G(I)/G(S)/G(T) subunit beta-1
MSFAQQIQENQGKLSELKARIEQLRDVEELKETMKSVNDGKSKLSHEFKQCKLLQGHFGKIYAMDWGKDEDTVLSAAQDGSLILWNAFTNNKLDVINLRSSWVMSCAMSPSGRMTASGGLDNICTIYKIPETPDGKDLKAHKELLEHTGYLSGAAFIDDTKVISSSGDSQCILWDIEKGQYLNIFKGHESDVMDVTLIPDTNLFVSGSCDTTCKVWDYRDWKADVMTFPGHDSDINTVDASRGGNAFISGGDDSAVILHDVRSYGPLQQYHEANIVCSVTSIALSDSSRMIFGGYDDNICRAWDTLTGEVISEMTDHRNRVSCLGVSAQGTALCTGGWDQILRVWA